MSVGTSRRSHIHRLVVYAALAAVWVTTVDQIFFQTQVGHDATHLLITHIWELLAALVVCLALHLLFFVAGTMVPGVDTSVFAASCAYAVIALYGAIVLVSKDLISGSHLLFLLGAQVPLAVWVVALVRRWSFRSIGSSLLAAVSMMVVTGAATNVLMFAHRAPLTRRYWWIQIVVHLGVVLPIGLWTLRQALREDLTMGRRIRRVGVPVVLMLLMCSGSWFLTRNVARREDSPNVILIVLDTLRRDHVGLLGNRAATPSIDGFFQDGAIFESAIAPSSSTLPSMTAMFGARHPGIRLNRNKNANRVASDVQTLADALGQRGYATGAFTANALLGPASGMLRGFQEVMILNHHKRRDELLRAPPIADHLYARVRGKFAPDSRFADVNSGIIHRGKRFLETHRDESFFMWLHLMSPHDPYDMDPEAVTDGYAGRLSKHEFAPHDRFPSEADFREGRFVLTESDKDHISYLYARETEEIDALLGPLFDYVARLKLLDNTIVVLTSDHGEELWDHGDYYHGQSLFEELVGVPLLVKGPGLNSQRIGAPISTLSVMPSLKEMCGVPETADVDAGTFLDALRGKQGLPTPSFSAQHDRHLYSLRDERWTAIWNSFSGELLLYERGTDAGEKSNVAEVWPQISQDYLALIRAERDKVRVRASKVRLSAKDSEEIEKQLRSLGYL